MAGYEIAGWVVYVHQERRLVYLAHPKTASISVRDALGRRGFVRAGRPHHATLDQHPGDGWLVFTTVRNHFDAWASWWSFRSIKTKEHLDRVFVDRTVRIHLDYFPVPDRMWSLHRTYADIVLRYERQEESLRLLLDEPGLVLGRENVSEKRAGRSYQELVSVPLRRFIENRYAEEMDELGYEWEDG